MQIRNPQPAAAPVAVVHIPHSSTYIPPDVRASLAINGVALDREIARMTDWYTDRLFSLPENVATSVVFSASRLVVDPERFADDSQEPIAAAGMGAVYTNASDGSTLRMALLPHDRGRLLDRFYHPHHMNLSIAVRNALEANGVCLIIDGHSFPSRPLAYELDQSLDRPHVCIGRDADHTPSWLIDCGFSAFKRHGYAVAIDRPFAGALVPGQYHRQDPRVLSIMVEVNRGLYMDEAAALPAEGFEHLRIAVSSALMDLIRSVRERVGMGVH